MEKSLSSGCPLCHDLNHYARETGAWQVSSYAAQALGMSHYGPHGGDSELYVWNKGWKAADVETKRAKGVQNVVNFMRDKSSDADMRATYSSEHHHYPPRPIFHKCDCH